MFLLFTAVIGTVYLCYRGYSYYYYFETKPEQVPTPTQTQITQYYTKIVAPKPEKTMDVEFELL